MRPDDEIITPGIGHLGPLDFKARLDAGESFAVLDVREDHERDHAAIPLPERSVDLHIPLGQLSARFDEIIAGRQDRDLVIYCHQGQRSMVAAHWLTRRGIAGISNLEGGIDLWSRRVDPSVPRY